MKNAFTLDIDFKQFEKDIGKLAKKSHVSRAVKKSLLKVAKQIRKDARPEVPNDTGELEQSWEIQINSATDIDAGYNIVYAMYQHQGRRDDGTHIIRNRPAGGKSFFLRDTVDKNLSTYYKMFEEYFFEELGL